MEEFWFRSVFFADDVVLLAWMSGTFQLSLEKFTTEFEVMGRRISTKSQSTVLCWKRVQRPLWVGGEACLQRCPTRRTPTGKPKMCWRDHFSWLAWRGLDVLPEDLVEDRQVWACLLRLLPRPPETRWGPMNGWKLQHQDHAGFFHWEAPIWLVNPFRPELCSSVVKNLMITFFPVLMLPEKGINKKKNVSSKLFHCYF